MKHDGQLMLCVSCVFVCIVLIPHEVTGCCILVWTLCVGVLIEWETDRHSFDIAPTFVRVCIV